MKKGYWQIAALLFLVACFGACKKSSPQVKTKIELLAQSTWKLSTAVAAGFGDITSQVPACYKDNIYTFVSDGSGTINESTNVCSPTTAGPFTWSLLNNETTLHLSATIFTGGSSDFTLTSLTETNLVISQVVTIAPLPATNVTFTFIH